MRVRYRIHRQSLKPLREVRHYQETATDVQETRLLDRFSEDGKSRSTVDDHRLAVDDHRPAVDDQLSTVNDLFSEGEKAHSTVDDHRPAVDDQETATSDSFSVGGKARSTVDDHRPVVDDHRTARKYTVQITAHTVCKKGRETHRLRNES